MITVDNHKEPLYTFSSLSLRLTHETERAAYFIPFSEDYIVNTLKYTMIFPST